MIEFVVGIDIGHGETSAAICSIGAASRLRDVAMELVDGEGRQTLPSIYAEYDDGRVLLGTPAKEGRLTDGRHLHVAFKHPPSNTPGEPERIMLRFMEAVYGRVRAVSPDLEDANHLVYLAAPSGWSPEQRKAYRALAQSGKTLFSRLVADVVSESRAAFALVSSKNEGFRITEQRGGVVLDLGSSTLDLTYRLRGQRPLDKGYPIGSEHIDQAIYKHRTVTGCDTKKLDATTSGNLDAALLYEGRKAKEAFFRPATEHGRGGDVGPEPAAVRCNAGRAGYDIQLDSWIQRPGAVSAHFNEQELSEWLAAANYIGQLYEDIADFCSQPSGPRSTQTPLAGVAMTGSASRMPFLKQLVKDAFKPYCDENTRIWLDLKPGLAISRGTSLLGRMDQDLKEVNKKIDTFFHDLSDGKKLSLALASELKSKLPKAVTATVFKTMREWIALPGAQSVNDLTALIERPGYLDSELQTCIEECIRETFAEVTKPLVELVAQAVEVYSVGVKQQMPGQTQVGAAVNLNYNFITGAVAKAVSSSLGAIAGTLIGAVVAIVTTVLRFIPVWGWIIGGLITVASWIFGSDSDEEARAKQLNRADRQKAYDKLTDNDIHTKVETALSAPGAIDPAQLASALSKAWPGFEQGLRQTMQAAKEMVL